MNAIMNYVLLAIGFFILIKGADIFVDSASGIARRFNIPSMIIGLTLVAMGTSAPELSVSITSALQGFSDMSVANVVGSNIFNLLAIFGYIGLTKLIPINNFKDIKSMMLSYLLLLILMLDNGLSRIDGLILLICFGIFMYDTIKTTKENPEESNESIKDKPLWMNMILTIIGLGAIIAGGNLVVNNASDIAMQLGMSEKLVGLTIVAVGTSLPEFVTSVVAMRKGESGIALGNVFGSNIFNTLLILGVSASLNPMVGTALVDVIFMTIVSGLFAVLMFKNKGVNKRIAILMFVIYVLYIANSIV